MSQPLHTCALAPDPPVAEQTAPDAEEFIYLITHDLRSSVRALLELPQWIAEDLAEAGFEMDGAVAESFALMNRHSRRLDRMLVDLLAHSRIGRLQAIREVDLGVILSKLEESHCRPADFSLIRSLACRTLVMGERDIDTLLTALIDNAVRHHDQAQGQIAVASRVEDGEVVLTVTDDGPGIAPEFHDRVFQPMTTLRSRDEVEGTGLGLANVRKIAAVYQGTAQLQVVPQGRGTCLELRLPGTVLGNTE